MDVIERVRDFGHGAEPLADESLEHARRRLLSAEAAERPVKRGLRRRLVPLALVGAVAATVVVVSVILPARAPSAAADVLRSAASLSAAAVDIDVPAGSFLKVESTSSVLMLWDADMSTQWARFNNGNPRSAEAGLDVQATRTIYVPSNRDDDWVVVDTPQEVVKEYGPRVDEARADWNYFSPRTDSESQVYPGGLLQTPDGGSTAYLDKRGLYAEMPRDPEELLSWWRERSGLTGQEADRWVVSGIAEDLSVNMAPADLRASMFEALALLPDARVHSVDGDTTTLSFPWKMNDRKFETRITLNTVEGLLTAVTQLEFVDGTIFSSPVALQSETVSTGVVDTVPKQ